MEERSKKGTKVKRWAPIKQAMIDRISWSGGISNWLLEDSVMKGRMGDWRFLTCENFGSLFVIVSDTDCAGLLSELCWSVARPAFRLLVRIVLYFLLQPDCAPLSLAYRLVTCHNSFCVVTDRTLISLRQRHGISNRAPEGGSTHCCLVGKMWLP
jgi:hypothetical protein